MDAAVQVRANLEFTQSGIVIATEETKCKEQTSAS